MIELAREVLAGIRMVDQMAAAFRTKSAALHDGKPWSGREAAFSRNADTRIRSRWLGAMLAGEHALASINARAADAGFNSR